MKIKERIWHKTTGLDFKIVSVMNNQERRNEKVFVTCTCHIIYTWRLPDIYLLRIYHENVRTCYRDEKANAEGKGTKCRRKALVRQWLRS